MRLAIQAASSLSRRARQNRCSARRRAAGSQSRHQWRSREGKPAQVLKPAAQPRPSSPPLPLPSCLPSSLLPLLSTRSSTGSRTRRSSPRRPAALRRTRASSSATSSSRSGSIRRVSRPMPASLLRRASTTLVVRTRPTTRILTGTSSFTHRPDTIPAFSTRGIPPRAPRPSARRLLSPRFRRRIWTRCSSG